MIEILSRWLIKDRDKITDPTVRSAYGTLCSVIGIVLNLLLFAGKYLAGILSASIAITADAFNNLSDAGSSLISLLGFKLAARKPDPEHPYGHGRLEYISGFLIALIIVLLGVELFKTSLQKVLNPKPSEWSLAALLVLVASILVKGYMALYNRRYGRRINSSAMRAAAADSLSDMLVTALVLAATLVGRFFHIQIDGWGGLIVSVFIILGGLTTAKDTVAPLLGSAADPETVRQIAETVLSAPMVIGLHDMMIHDYGPGRQIISLHAEFPSDADFVAVHETVDELEIVLNERFGFLATVHMDPIAVGDPETDRLKEKVLQIASSISPEITIHDFRNVKGESHIKLVFDAVIPFSFAMTDEEVIQLFKKELAENIGPECSAVIRIDKPLI